MPSTHTILYFETEAKEVADRLRSYMTEDSRPASADEVPELEIDIFNAIANNKVPDDIALGEDNSLTAWFDYFEEKQALEICDALQKWQGIIQCYAYFTDDEEYKAYVSYKNGKFKTLYTYLDDQELDGKLWDLGWEMPGLSLILKDQEHKD